MVFVITILSIITFFTIFNNVLALYSLLRRKYKTNYIVLCINLSLSDLMESVAGYLPALFLNSEYHKASFLCKASAFFTAFSAFTSISLLVGVALTRMVLLNAPFLTNDVKYKAVFKKVGLLSWVYALFWAIFPIFGISSYTLETTNSRCSINWAPASITDRVYLILLVIFCFIVPNIIILASCLFTASVMRKKFNYFARTYGKENLETRRFKEKEKKAFSSFTFMVLTFSICWTPYATVGVLSAFTTIRLPLWLLETAALLAKTSTMVNPIIYALKDNLFKNFFKIQSRDKLKSGNRTNRTEFSVKGSFKNSALKF